MFDISDFVSICHHRFSKIVLFGDSNQVGTILNKQSYGIRHNHSLDYYSESIPKILKKSWRFGKDVAELLEPALPNIEHADHDTTVKYHSARTIEGVL